jgi:hypothetical protein
VIGPNIEDVVEWGSREETRSTWWWWCGNAALAGATPVDRAGGDRVEEKTEVEGGSIGRKR